jgi:hypothetical protein
MSGILSLFQSADSSTTGELLGTLFGTSSSISASQNPITALDQAEQNQTQDIAATAQQPDVKRDISTFTSVVQNAKSVSDILNNPTAMKVLLTANGLGDQISYTALAQKALTSNINDPNSLVNQLGTTNTNWTDTVKTYDFANKGLSVIQNPKVISTLANAYAEVTWRQSLDATTPGLSNALTFRSEASSITSVDQILGDSTMRTVVTTALGLPLELAIQPLDAQEKAISTRLDISQFQNPTFVDQFVQRYLIAAQSSSTSTNTTDLTSLAVQAQGLVV